MKNIKYKIYSKLILVEIVIITSMRFLLPVLANYPPYSETYNFQVKVETITHNTQYILLGLIAITLHLVFINIFFKNIFNYLNKGYKETNIEETKQIREDCYTIPKKLVIIQMTLLTLMLVVLFNVVEMSLILYIKFLLIYFSFFTAAWVISIVLIKKDLNRIIESTYMRFKEYEMPLNSTKFYKTLIINLLPLFIVIIVSVTLFGYASTTERMGEGLYYYYKQRHERFKFKQ